MRVAIPDYKQGVDLPSLLWSDVPGTVGFEETVLLMGSNAGCKTRLRTTCLPSVNVLLLPPFRFLVPTFSPAFFGMWDTERTL